MTRHESEAKGYDMSSTPFDMQGRLGEDKLKLITYTSANSTQNRVQSHTAKLV